MLEILRRLGRWPKGTVACLSYLLLGLIGFGDHLLGPRVTLSYLYLLPIFIVTWRLGKTNGIVISFVGAALWAVSDLMFDPSQQASHLDGWNALVLLGFYLTVSFLVSALQKTLSRLQELAKVDPLTGIANRRAFLDAAEIERRRALRSGNAFALAFLDLDNFKAINDSCGHDVGDAVLRKVAQTMTSSLRATDLASRLGGDEFAVLLPFTDHDRSQVVLRKLQSSIIKEMEEESWPVTLSVGVVVCEDPKRGIEELLAKADALMYLSKTSGKNNLRFEVVVPLPTV